MSKFKVRFKLEKLEFEVEGERASVPDATAAIQKHLSALLMSPAALAGAPSNGGSTEKVVNEAREIIPDRNHKPRKSRLGMRGSVKASGESQASALDFRHDPEKWGNPQQGWSTAKKSMWLLFVIKNQTETKEMSALGIAETFNKHFRSAGAIKSFNVTRDLGKAKQVAPASMGEDTTKNPSLWYLTDEGKKIARTLVAAATGAATAAAGNP